LCPKLYNAAELNAATAAAPETTGNSRNYPILTQLFYVMYNTEVSIIHNTLNS